MSSLFAAPDIILSLLSLAMFVAQAFAFVDSATQRPDAYVAAIVYLVDVRPAIRSLRRS